jgi:hypothetical protein
MNIGESLLSGKLGEKLPNGDWTIVFNYNKGEGFVSEEALIKSNYRGKPDNPIWGIVNRFNRDGSDYQLSHALAWRFGRASSGSPLAAPLFIAKYLTI